MSGSAGRLVVPALEDDVLQPGGQSPPCPGRDSVDTALRRMERHGSACSAGFWTRRHLARWHTVPPTRVELVQSPEQGPHLQSGEGPTCGPCRAAPWIPARGRAPQPFPESAKDRRLNSLTRFSLPVTLPAKISGGICLFSTPRPEPSESSAHLEMKRMLQGDLGTSISLGLKAPQLPDAKHRPIIPATLEAALESTFLSIFMRCDQKYTSAAAKCRQQEAAREDAARVFSHCTHRIRHRVSSGSSPKSR
ncbi:hypothetical protein H920_10453 [Fukomys damarensis]|uniref:Uncharacterized protein n=1 Tax=Fukomys damarensis TaxID=885580 RepID=A0A091D7I6_FUKDA|nr:hypothetical protein H920_10453 [Fukomys damarensis]